MIFRINKGFTLIELMFTIAIVGIFSAIAIPGYREFIIKGMQSEARAELSAINVRFQRVISEDESYLTNAGKYDLLVNSGYTEPHHTENYQYSSVLNTNRDGYRIIAFPAKPYSTTTNGRINSYNTHGDYDYCGALAIEWSATGGYRYLAGHGVKPAPTADEIKECWNGVGVYEDKINAF